jgi:uncharacterized protein (TIGR03083 family)
MSVARGRLWGMESKRLLECLDTDFHRLREVVAGADLTATVPSCPEWTVADLARHVGAVYLHKVECMRLGTHPESWPPPGLNDEDPVALLDRAYPALSAEFAARTPESHAFTWYEPDQTVGFWIRRMAQETVIHRVDAELGAAAEQAPIPSDLAIDGIDEFLIVFTAYGAAAYPEEYAPLLSESDGRAVRLSTPDAAFLVRPTVAGIEVAHGDADNAAATVHGDATDLLLWVWGRADDDRVTVTGDPALVSYVRKVFAAGAQ